MTRPHHHPMRDQRGMASIEHEHPGPERRHVHEGQPELMPSVDGELLLDAMKKAARLAGVRLEVPD